MLAMILLQASFQIKANLISVHSRPEKKIQACYSENVVFD